MRSLAFIFLIFIVSGIAQKKQIDIYKADNGVTYRLKDEIHVFMKSLILFFFSMI